MDGQQMLVKEVEQCIIIEIPFKSIDIENANEFKKTFLSSYFSSQYSDVIMNLENVNYIDAAGLEALLFAGDMIQESRGKVSLYNVEPFVKQVLLKSRLYKFFDINRTIEDSLEYIKDTELLETGCFKMLRNKLKIKTA